MKKTDVTNIIRQYLLFVLSLSISAAFSQKNGDYILKDSKDTVYAKVIKMDRHMKQVTCLEGGRRVSYKAKNILVFKKDSLLYESGFVRLKMIRSKRYCFLEKKISGNLNLYETSVCNGSWTLTGWAGHRPHPVFFYKKQNESRMEFSKNWKKKTRNCKVLQDKINSKAMMWNPSPRELVGFYNKNCE